MTESAFGGPVPRARTLRVFVSSTFRDMQAERDELAKRTFPNLRRLCQERGITWADVDLRWGISTEEAADGGDADEQRIGLVRHGFPERPDDRHRAAVAERVLRRRARARGVEERGHRLGRVAQEHGPGLGVEHAERAFDQDDEPPVAAPRLEHAHTSPS